MGQKLWVEVDEGAVDGRSTGNESTGLSRWRMKLQQQLRRQQVAADKWSVSDPWDPESGGQDWRVEPALAPRELWEMRQADVGPWVVWQPGTLANSSVRQSSLEDQGGMDQVD
jgi:hypothetical protein